MMTTRTTGIVAVLAAAGLLAGCGAQGAPQPRGTKPVDTTTTQRATSTSPTTGPGTSTSRDAPSEDTSSPTASPTPSRSSDPSSTSEPRQTPSSAPSSSSGPRPSSSSATGPQAGTEAPTATSEPSTPASELTPPPTTEPSPTPERTSLRPGDSGPAVLQLQHRLSELGYWLGTPDGTYGHLTSQAVMALQGAAGLSRDGVYGPRTQAALEQGVRPPVHGGPADRVEIDLARQVLLVVRGGAVRYVLHTSTGSGARYRSSSGEWAVATTPRGTYSVFRVVDGKDVAPLGTLYRPRYFTGGIAVHGLGSVPGYPASHGCARVSNAAMDMIWAQGLMPIGSAVVVH